MIKFIRPIMYMRTVQLQLFRSLRNRIDQIFSRSSTAGPSPLFTCAEPWPSSGLVGSASTGQTTFAFDPKRGEGRGRIVLPVVLRSDLECFVSVPLSVSAETVLASAHNGIRFVVCSRVFHFLFLDRIRDYCVWCVCVGSSLERIFFEFDLSRGSAGLGLWSDVTIDWKLFSVPKILNEN